MRTRPPSLGMEHQLWDEGHEVVVGVDEVGRGAWAGPFVVSRTQ
jgi:ribonuclease HII